MKTTKKLVLIIILMLVTIISFGGVTNAALQSVGRGETYSFYNNNNNNPVLGIRQMETTGGGMGLNEEIETTSGPNRGLATTESNNIDVHMLKNTEYGAIVLLGASDYGKQGTKLTDRYMNKGTTIDATKPMASTTGNKYGIFEIGYYNMNSEYSTYESVAGLLDISDKIYAPRYINSYTGSEKSALPGDATVEVNGWHAGSNGRWIDNSNRWFVRGMYGSFYYTSSTNFNYARAAVVVGKGF